MKTLKKYFKVILCFMAFALASFAFAFSPISPVYATSAELASILLKQVPTKVAKGEDLKINLPVGHDLVVIEPTGKKHVLSEDTENEYFSVSGSVVTVAKEKLVGSTNPYRVYFVKNGNYTREYRVFVEVENSTLKLVENDGLKVLLPAKMAKSADKKYNLPKTALIDDETPEVAVTVSLYKDDQFVVSYKLGEEPESNEYVADNKFSPKDEGAYTLVYSASNCNTVKYSFTVEEGYVAPAKEDITFETPTVSGIELGKKGITLNSLKITDKNGNDVAYNLTKLTIEKDGSQIKKELLNNTYVFDMTTEFFGVDDYSSMTGLYKFTFEVKDVYDNTLTKTVEVKNVTASKVPTVYMAYDYDKTTERANINTHADVDLKDSVGYKELILPAVYAEDYVSAPDEISYLRYLSDPNDNSKRYYVDNLVWYGGELCEIEYNKGTKTFRNTKKPEDPNNYYGNFALVTKSGEDYLTESGDPRKSQEMKFAEEYNDDYVKNFCGDDKGVYDVHYYAYSKVVNTRSGHYDATIKVEATAARARTHDSIPQVEITNVIDRSSIEAGSELKVNVVATDGEKNVKTSVYYAKYSDITNIKTNVKTLANTALQSALGDYEKEESEVKYTKSFGKSNILDSTAFKNAFTNFVPADNNLDAEDSYNVAKLGEDSDAGYYVVVALSINDDNDLGISLKVLKIKDMSDETAPTVDDDGWDNEKVVAQQEVVGLPTVTFADGKDDDLSLSVAYYVVKDGEDFNYKYFAPNAYHCAENKISNVKINADVAGKYYVVYTATDDAGNSTTVFYTFEAKQTGNPILTVGATGEGLTKSGNTLTGNLTPSGLTVNFDVEMWSADGKHEYTRDADGDETVESRSIDYVINANGVDYDYNGGNSFTFKSEGKVTITFNGEVKYKIGGVTYERKAISKTFTVDVKLPTLVWENESKLNDLETGAKKGNPIELPVLVATQGAYGVTTDIKVEYIKGTEKKDVTKEVLVDYTFTPNEEEGRYVVTYTATSDKGSTITASHTFKVGDTYKPTFTVSGDDNLKKDISLVTDGTIKYKVTVNRSEKKFKVTVDGKEYSLDIKIKDRNKDGVEGDMAWTDLKFELLKDGSAVSGSGSNNEKSYELTSTGAYTLRIYIADANANEGEYKISFNVVNASEPSTKTDLALGIVLIVLSVVVLAGAIVFFIFAGRKGGKGKGKKDKNVEDNSNNENNNDAKSGDVE